MSTPIYEKVNNALCQSKIVFLVIYGGTQKRDEAIAICKEAALKISEYKTEIITVDLHDKVEKPLLKALRIEENPAIPFTVIITPQALAKQFGGIIDTESLVNETRNMMNSIGKCGCGL